MMKFASCVCITLMVIVGVFIVLPGFSEACYGYTISCGGVSFSDSDGGAEDVEYHWIDAPGWDIAEGESYTYVISFNYWPGCTAKYNGKFYYFVDKPVSTVTCTLQDLSGNDISGIEYDWHDSGSFDAYLTVFVGSGSTLWETCGITVRLWCNDTQVCNEHNTIDVRTVSRIGPTTEQSPAAPTIDMWCPVGGDVLWSPYNYQVKWNAAGGKAPLVIDLDYSISGSSGPWLTLARGESNDGVYDWKVPPTPSTDCYIKATVTDSNYPPLTDVFISEQFEIRISGSGPYISLQSPIGGEIWVVNTTHQITWLGGGGTSPLTVDLYYSTSASSWKSISMGEANDGSYTWTVPSDPSTTCKVRAVITDSDSPPQTREDESPAYFTISTTTPAPTITVTMPYGGENWTSGTQKDVTWSTSGGIGPHAIDIEYSTQGISGPWIAIVKNETNDGVYKWTIPSASSSNCFVKATATDSSSPPKSGTDTNNVAFTIYNGSAPPPAPDPTIRLISPNGGENWTVGTTHDVKWTAIGGTGALGIKLELSTVGLSGPWSTLANNEANDGIYSWLVPSSPSINCHIRATAIDSGTPPRTASDLSNASFTINVSSLPVPTVKINAPDGGEKWDAGTTHEINWSASGGTGALRIRLEYSQSGVSGPWSIISVDEPNDGIYPWTIPTINTTDAYVRATVTDSASTPMSAVDTSNSAFIITIPGVNNSKPPLQATLVAPNGGEKWEAGTHHDIGWVASGGSGTISIDLELSVSGISGPWSFVSQHELHDGVFDWLVPAVNSTNCVIRLTATDSGTTKNTSTDTSNAVFTIFKQQGTFGNGTISGKVVSDSGTIIADAKITIIKNGSVVNTINTDTLGRYSIELVAGSYILNASKAGYYHSTNSVIGLESGESVTQDFQLKKMGTNQSPTPPVKDNGILPLLQQPMFLILVVILVVVTIIAGIAASRRKGKKQNQQKPQWAYYTGAQQPSSGTLSTNHQSSAQVMRPLQPSSPPSFPKNKYGGR